MTASVVMLVVLTTGWTPTAGADTPVPPAALTPPPAGLRGYPLWDSYFDLAPLGYEEQEYFVSGTAVDGAGTARAVHDPHHRHPAHRSRRRSTARCSSTG